MPLHYAWRHGESVLSERHRKSLLGLEDWQSPGSSNNLASMCIGRHLSFWVGHCHSLIEGVHQLFEMLRCRSRITELFATHHMHSQGLWHVGEVISKHGEASIGGLERPPEILQCLDDCLILEGELHVVRHHEAVIWEVSLCRSEHLQGVAALPLKLEVLQEFGP